VKPAWAGFESDLNRLSCLDVDRRKLTDLLRRYFVANGLTCDWDAIEFTPDERLITALAMVCPLDPQEKQLLLEAEDCHRRAAIFMGLLEMAVVEAEKTAGGSSNIH
jgi:Lon protease-like protein